MAFTALSDVYDPIKIMRIIGQDWLNDAKIMMSGIARRDARPVQGTLTHELRHTRFQDTSGQAVVAGGSISSQKHTQSRKIHPVIWRYQSADEPDVIEEIEVKGVPAENATMAEDIRKAATQYVDDSAVATIKGAGAALTSNQEDSTGSVITLVDLVNGFAKLNEDGFKVQGGGMAMHSAVYWKLVALGVVAATSNTYGNTVQTQMVLSGNLPTNVLGMTPIVSDKFSVVTGSNYYMYYIGKDVLVIRGNDVPQVEVARATVNKKFSTITNFKVAFGIGIDGTTWGVTGKENVTDTDLSTSGNWTLAASNSQDVALVRNYVQIA